MKRKFIILSCVLVLFAVVIGVYIVKNTEKQELIKQSDISQEKEKISLATNIDSKDIVLDLVSDLNYAIDTSKSDVRNENAEFIVIGKVESLEGATNYNPITKEYTDIQTIGNIKIEKVIKGNLDKEIIPFIRTGGIIKFAEYEKGLKDAQRNKLQTLDAVKTLTTEEKQTKYVSSTIRDNISVENGKTYLMYLNYVEDYDRYGIVFLQDGLREVDVSNSKNLELNVLSAENYANIKVKNNNTGKFESLSDVLGNLETNLQDK